MKASQLVIDLLNEKYEQFNRPDFIPNDPICIPHRFKKKQDIEIAAFFAAVLAWGQRKTIINKCTELLDLLDNAPHQFVTQHHESDLKRLLRFKHRTFNATDTLYFIEFFKHHYERYESLEDAFLVGHLTTADNVQGSLLAFHDYFFSLPEYPNRTRKHVAIPLRKSSCKRLNMYLRWMVRNDGRGVDFGLWQNIRPDQLICPCDVHVERIARHLGLFTRPKPDWQAAVELTANLKGIDPHDPVKYDFALFGLGIEQYFLLLPK